MSLLAKRKTAFISTAGGIGVLGGFAGIFLILIIISCIYARYKYPNWRRRERDNWVRERRSVVQQQNAEAAEARRKIQVAMRMNDLRRSSDRSFVPDVEPGLAKPQPSFAGGSTRSDSLPPYDNASRSPSNPPSLRGPARMDSDYSIPSYSVNPPPTGRALRAYEAQAIP